jgi:hypothetical protein
MIKEISQMQRGIDGLPRYKGRIVRMGRIVVENNRIVEGK